MAENLLIVIIAFNFAVVKLSNTQHYETSVFIEHYSARRNSDSQTTGIRVFYES